MLTNAYTVHDLPSSSFFNTLGNISDVMDECKERFCILHKEGSKYNPDGHFISPLTYKCWVTLLEAARIEKHDALLKIAGNTNEGEVPTLFYHRKCRSAFTL